MRRVPHHHTMTHAAFSVMLLLPPYLALQFSYFPIEFTRSARVLRARELMTAATDATSLSSTIGGKNSPLRYARDTSTTGFLLDPPLGLMLNQVELMERDNVPRARVICGNWA